MNFQNKTTTVEYDNGTFVVHTRIIDITKYTKTTVGYIKEDLYNFSRNEERKYKYIISFSNETNNKNVLDDAGNIKASFKNALINNLYADLYNYLFMEYNSWNFYSGAKRQHLKELNISIDIIPYDDYFEKIEEIQDKENSKKNKAKDKTKDKKRGKNARKKENRKK